MEFEFVSKTDPGLRRENNEDAVVFDAANGLAILADGMGGYNAGEVASSMTAVFLSRELGAWLEQVAEDVPLQEIERSMQLCIANANTAVFNASVGVSAFNGMGTTLVAGIFRGDTLTLAHVGDSRCYRLRHGLLQAITKDHSLLQEQIDAGLIRPEHQHASSIKNLITRALGVDEVVEPEVQHHMLEAGDHYLFCSDGLSDMVGDEQIARIMRNDVDLEQKATSLIDIANDAGGRDNISVLLVECSRAVSRRGILAKLLRK